MFRSKLSRIALALTTILSLGAFPDLACAQDAAPPPSAASTDQGAPAFSSDQIDELVAPIALYPDPLVAQILPASTYPLDIVKAARWV